MVRSILGFGALAGTVVLVIVGWVTGFFAGAWTWALGMWDSLMAWVDQPFDLMHLFAGVGVILVPVLIIGAIVLILTDG